MSLASSSARMAAPSHRAMKMEESACGTPLPENFKIPYKGMGAMSLASSSARMAAPSYGGDGAQPFSFGMQPLDNSKKTSAKDVPGIP